MFILIDRSGAGSGGVVGKLGKVSGVQVLCPPWLVNSIPGQCALHMPDVELGTT